MQNTINSPKDVNVQAKLCAFVPYNIYSFNKPNNSPRDFPDR